MLKGIRQLLLIHVKVGDKMSSDIIRLYKQITEDPASRLIALINTAEPEIRDTFLRVVNVVRNQRTLNELVELLEQGRIEEALALADNIPLTVASAVTLTVVNSGTSTADLIARVIEGPVDFDQTNQRAVAIMRGSRLRLIREFTQEQRNATREALVNGIQRGANPREQARIFRDSIGLTTNQIRAVENYRRLLQQGSLEALSRRLRDARFDSTVRRSVRNDEPLTDTQINRMVTRYQERYLRYRSEVIARTEALRAVHQGTEEMYQQAFDNGVLNPNDLTREWVTADDARVRDTHDGMNGQMRLVGEPFTSDGGIPLRYPGDENAPAAETIQCRCVLTTRFA